MVADVGFVKGGAELSVGIPFGFGWRHSLDIITVEMTLGCRVIKRTLKRLYGQTEGD